MPYTVLFSSEAKSDIQQVVGWTEENFGIKQRVQYRRIITTAVRVLAKSPTKPPCRLRQDIGNGVYYLHIARTGKKARHFFLYRILPDKHIRVLRLLHDAMDITQAKL